MYIREIHIGRFRHIEDVHLGPFTHPPEHSELVVLAGPNAGGKSSVLELLGFALSNTWSLRWGLGRSFPSHSFEVAMAVTPNERQLVLNYLESNPGAGSYPKEVLEDFEQNGIYFRSFNYGSGRYQENPSLFGQIHTLVTNTLRSHYSRPLGFFIKSDRTYPTYGFQRETIFSYSQILQRDHIWSMAFNTSDLQYRDIFEFLVQQRYHYLRRLGSFHRKLKVAPSDAGPEPTDPLEPYDLLLQKLFPGYKFADGDEDVPSNLFVRLPSEEVIPFSDLSSGEKEVFFILAFFLRHDVTNAIIVIDEPELHLHPELARLLIRTMQSIKPGNQIWLATHNPEIIDEAGRDRVVYLAPDRETRKVTIALGANEPEAMRRLKDFFGFSGYVGVARTLVFLEGLESSSDRKMFTTLFPEYGSKVKFVPVGSVENLARINAAVLSVLEANLGWMDFYLIRDRDYLTQEFITKYREHASGRLHVLSRCQIENYLLDEELIAKVQRNTFNKVTSPERVAGRLRSIAFRISGETLRDMLSFRLNLIFRPEDLSLGRLFEGQPILEDGGTWIDARIDEFRHHFLEKVCGTRKNLLSATEGSVLDDLIERGMEELGQAFIGGSDGWRTLFSGRRLLEEYARQEDLGQPVILQNSLIKEMSAMPERIPMELRRIIATIIEGRPFSP